jgi:hypothetical protein
MLMGDIEGSLAFSIREGLLNNTPNDASDDLLAAGRWPHVPETLSDHDVRGLGGGIEYSYAADFCERILPRFADSPSPDCLQIRLSVQQGLDRWTVRHPFLRFRDVSDRLPAAMPDRSDPDPNRGHGAELDIFAMTEDEYPQRAYPDSLALRGRGTRTRFWSNVNPPLGTNGRYLPGRSITAIDHVLNQDVCYFLDPAHANATVSGRRCNHWESLAVLMGGRALGLGNPNLDPGRWFDDDDDPTNVIPIDCETPTRGLRLTEALDSASVMVVQIGTPLGPRLTLSPDDLGGRDFLYPVCPGFG